ncbi:MAG: DUF4124 domain-containing protein, partial [Pseudomonas sp.]
MQRLFLLGVLTLAATAQAAPGRYLTWVDDQGRVHNTFVDSHYSQQQRDAAKRIVQSDQERMNQGATPTWPSAKNNGESKRRYFTWVDASGNLQNSFYAGAQLAGAKADNLLSNGQHASDYIDSDVLEGRNFARPENGSPYYTWVDEQGRMHNSPTPGQGRAAAPEAPSNVRYTEGRQIEFGNKAAVLPALDGQPSAAMQALLAGSAGR